MRTIQQLRYVALIIALIVITGCKKDSNTSSTPAKLLNSAPWKETKDEWQQTTTGVWVDQVAAGKAVLSTAALTFFDNNTWSINGGAYGTWSLSSDNTQLTMFGNNGTSLTITVAALNSTTLQMTSPLTNTYTVTMNPYVITYYNIERDTYTH